MKTLILVLFSSLLLTACNNAGTGDNSTDSSTIADTLPNNQLYDRNSNNIPPSTNDTNSYNRMNDRIPDTTNN